MSADPIDVKEQWGPYPEIAAVCDELIAARTEIERLRARLDAAEAIAEEFSYTADDVKLLIAEAEAERDAALARAVPDGMKLEPTDGWEVFTADDGERGIRMSDGLYRLVPADTDPGEPT